jgi:hypothetical protein
VTPEIKKIVNAAAQCGQYSAADQWLDKAIVRLQEAKEKKTSTPFAKSLHWAKEAIDTADALFSAASAPTSKADAP